MDDDVARGLSRLVAFAPLFTDWVCGAMATYEAEHSEHRRTRLSTWTRDNYIYDETIATAEIAKTPVPITIRQYRRMRWLTIPVDGLIVAVWFKKINHSSLLTSIYPTDVAVQRQRDWNLFGQSRHVLFVCGHTISEDIAGSNAWINDIVITQEKRNAYGVRRVTLARRIYNDRPGVLPLEVADRQMEMDFQQKPPQIVKPIIPAIITPASPVTPPPKVRPRRPAAVPNQPGMPKVGTDEARRAAEAAEAERLKRENEPRENGSQGA
jgi:hypothetical protein